MTSVCRGSSSDLPVAICEYFHKLRIHLSNVLHAVGLRVPTARFSPVTFDSYTGSSLLHVEFLRSTEEQLLDAEYLPVRV